MNASVIVVIGLLAGVFSGVVGVGGGIVIVPMLVMFASFSQVKAQGTAVAALIPPIGILAAYVYYKAGNVDIKAAGLIAAGFIVGGYMGAKVANSLDQKYLSLIFGSVLILVGCKVLWAARG